jgi:small multidrug resistance pump
MSYLYLTIAIIAEVIGTTALQASQQFTRLWPSLIVIGGYGCAFFFLSLVLQSIPVGVAYALWSGLGVVLVTLAGAAIFRQVPDLPAIIGMVLIVTGVIVMNLFSSAVRH